MGCVYIICCKSSKKVYIGKTKKSDLVRYLKHNVSLALNGSDNKPKLYRAIRKYGPSDFTAMKLFESPDEEMLFGWEKYFIQEWGSTEDSFGYNISKGGEGSGYKHGPDCKHCLWAKTEGAKILKENHHKRVYTNGPRGALKQFCKYGHPLSGDNIYSLNGMRGGCKTCARRRSEEQRKRNAI